MRVGVDVAQEARCRARAVERRGASQDLPQLAVLDGLGVVVAGDVDGGAAGVARDASAPLVAVVVAVGGVGARLGFGKGDVVVGVDEARRDRAVLARHHRGIHGGGLIGVAVAGGASDLALVINEDLAAVQRLIGQQHRAA